MEKPKPEPKSKEGKLEPLAFAALAAAVSAVAIDLLWCWVTTVIPALAALVFGIAAVVMGMSAKRSIESSKGRGLGLARSAIRLGALATVAAIALIVIGFFWRGATGGLL